MQLFKLGIFDSSFSLLTKSHPVKFCISCWQYLLQFQCSMYDLFSKSNFRIRPKNFSLWSYHVKPILLFLKLELALGSRLVTALCDNDSCTRWRMKRAGALCKGRTAWEGEPGSPDMRMDSSFSPALPVLPLGCWASATTGFTSLSIIIKLCWV